MNSRYFAAGISGYMANLYLRYHVFDKGAYFWTQVVPGTNGKMGLASKGGLSVISLNTMFVFPSTLSRFGALLNSRLQLLFRLQCRC
jgi:hypothetical protein